MSEWIDELASKVTRDQEQRRHQEEVWLRKNSAIRAKLPNFMMTLKRQVREDIEELRAKFPQNEQCHCSMEDRGDLGFRIFRQGSFPRIAIQFECNADGQFAHITEYTERDQYQGPIPSNRCEFNISLSDDNNLQFKALSMQFGPDKNRYFDSSKMLVEYLLRRVLS